MKASFSSTSYNQDALIAGHARILTTKGTLLLGQNVVRGAVLGKVSIGNASVAAKSGGNTGGGALTMDVTTPVLANAQVGVYTVRCTATASGGGTFRVYDPSGNVLGDVAVAATFSNQLKFVIADGAPDFSLGDGYDITVASGSGKYVSSLAAAVDGSQIPDAIAVEAVDATAADQQINVYTAGDFASSELTIGSGHSVASIREILRTKGINLISVVPA